MTENLDDIFEKQINESNIYLPKEDEIFGYVEECLGFSRYKIRCSDGYVRICTIPGRLKRKFAGKKRRIRAGDIVIVKPWEIQGDEKGDVLHKYTQNEVVFLKSKGYLDDLI